MLPNNTYQRTRYYLRKEEKVIHKSKVIFIIKTSNGYGYEVMSTDLLNMIHKGRAGSEEQALKAATYAIEVSKIQKANRYRSTQIRRSTSTVTPILRIIKKA